MNNSQEQLAALDAAIAADPENLTAEQIALTVENALVTPTKAFKDRKIYNYGTKTNPRWVITFKSVVYGQPDNFKSLGGTVSISETGDPGYMVDSDGNMWMSEGENAGCGPRCPPILKDASATKILALLDPRSIDALVLTAVLDKVGEMTLNKVFKHLSHAARASLISALSSPKR